MKQQNEFYAIAKKGTNRFLCKYQTKRKYDPPNWSPTTKALLDGLTDAEIWTDDNFNIIKRVSFEHGGLSGNKNYKIELNIHEVTGT